MDAREKSAVETARALGVSLHTAIINDPYNLRVRQIYHIFNDISRLPASPIKSKVLLSSRKAASYCYLLNQNDIAPPLAIRNTLWAILQLVSIENDN